MGLIDELSGPSVFLDTDVLIYFLQDHDRYAEIVTPLFPSANRGPYRAFSSVVVLCELLTRPLADGAVDVANTYRDYLQDRAIFELLPITSQVAQMGALLRAEHQLTTPDALNVAAARVAGVETFVTNDRRLRRVAAPAVLIVDDYA